jgi:hypothetical protein
MPFPCRDPATTLPVPSHYLSILRQCRTRAGRSLAVSGRPMLIHTCHAVPLPRPCHYPATTLPLPCHYPATTLPLHCHSPTVPNAGRSPTCRLWTANANSHIPCRSNAVPLPRPCRGLERSLSERHIRGMAGERHDMCESALLVHHQELHYCCYCFIQQCTP